MSATTSLNSQALEGAATVDALVAGLTPSATFALLDGVLTETLALAMHNAVARQQTGGVIAQAAVSAACARIAASADPLPEPGLQPPPPPPQEANP
jgi:threonine aldolase